MHLNKRIGVGVFLAGLVAVNVSQANPPHPLPRDTSATEGRSVTELCSNDIHWSAKAVKPMRETEYSTTREVSCRLGTLSAAMTPLPSGL
jgi:hypothetical protein